ncbi:MAG: preprotein translocase subunit SecG [Clostridia bacterium]|nr:preprotein translocase subunit SecG [Clostridia bacterium]
MVVVRNIVLVIYLIVCIALIIVATMQTKDNDGASGTITGSSTNNFYEKNKGRTKEGRIKKLTITLGIAFVVLAIVLGILYVIK